MGFLHIARSCALACMLMGCASVPTLRGSPEDVADAIGGNAVAYNQAYGRAVSNQVLLNILRARDRQPLFHLSMSGIQDSSEVARSGGFEINTVSLGDGDGGIGEVTGSSSQTTKPSYELNPFNHGESGTTAFHPIMPEFFQHYWDIGWPKEVLLLVMVDSVTRDTRREDTRFGNDGSNFRDACSAAEGVDPATTDGAAIAGRGCRYLNAIRYIAEADDAEFATNCGAWPARVEGRPQLPRTCNPTITVAGVPYRVELRALDDMLFYVGSLLRVEPQNGVMSTHVRVAPAGLYYDDTLPETRRVYPQRTAPLFRVTTPTERRVSGYAADVRYNGERYVAGPAISSNCVVGGCAPTHDGDRSAMVLSLLTQLVVLSQTNAAQEAPERVLTR